MKTRIMILYCDLYTMFILLLSSFVPHLMHLSLSIVFASKDSEKDLSDRLNNFLLLLSLVCVDRELIEDAIFH